MRHAWRRPRPGEQLHVEHLLRVVVKAVDDADDDREQAVWHFRSPTGVYVVVSDGRQWSLASRAPDGTAGVTVVADPDTFARFVVDPSAEQASRSGIELIGEDVEVEPFLRRIAALAWVAGFPAFQSTVDGVSSRRGRATSVP